MLLLCALVAGYGSAWATDVLSWSRSGSTNTYTSGYTFSASASANSGGYYQDNSTVGTTYGIKLYSTSSPICSTTPTTVTFTASVGGGSGNHDLGNSVYVCYVDDKGNAIDGTQTKVTDKITTASGDTYVIQMSTLYATEAYGIYIYHTKESGFNVRYYSFSLSYEAGGGNTPSIGLGTTTINATKAAVSTTSINVTYNNLTNYAAEVKFYEADGTTAATYDHSWLTAEINSTTKKLDYSIAENTGLERKAYLRVHALGDEGEVESNLITITQKGAKYKVYIQEPTGGTLEVRNGETLISDGDAVDDGTTLTITATAADGYRFKNWQAVDPTTHTYTSGNSYIINTHDVTFKANFDVEYSVNWSVNGNVTTEKYVNNETIVFPSRPADIVGKKFVGWTATEINGTQAGVPTLLGYGTKMGTSNVTYYAVFADASGESSTATLTESEIKANFTNSAMAYGTAKTYTDTSDGITWVASGFADQDRPWVQLKKDITAYFKISTTSKNIEEVKLTISNATNSSGGISDITKHGTFDGAVCLESAAKGTPSGAYASSDVVSNNIVTVSLPVSLSEFYIQVTAAARVWGVELTTNNYTYSNYRTTVPTTATITLNAACTDGDMVYGTYSNSQAFVVSEDIEVSEVKVVEGKLVVDSYATGAVVPANTGVMVAALEGGNYVVNLSSETGTSVFGNGNMLKPAVTAITADDMSAAAPSCKYYRLTMHNGTDIGFWWGAAEGTAFALAANKAYLAVPTSVGAPAQGFGFGDDETTGIGATLNDNVNDNVIYDLSGRRVTNPTKGLYIMNGKKVVIK